MSNAGAGGSAHGATFRVSHRWYCPACKRETVTQGTLREIPFHPCPQRHGMTIPMTRAGQKAKVELVERGDYIGTDHVQTDPQGRPWQSVVTTRDDGQDVAVFAPTAQLRSD